MSEETQPVQITTQDRGDGGLVNGMSNGYKKEHKSEHKDKHRDKDRHKDKDRHHSDKERDKHKHSSSKSSHKDKYRDKESDKVNDKDKDKHRDKERKDEKKHKDEKSTQKREHSSSKDNEHRSKEHKSSSSKDKDSKHHSSSNNKEKHKSSHSDKEKHGSSSVKHSSSSSKDKHHSSSSSKDRHSSSTKDKDKEKERSKDKDRNREHEKSKSSHSDHHKDRSKDKEREKKYKDKQKLEEKIKVEVKEEPDEEMENVNDSADENLKIDEDVKMETEDDYDGQNQTNYGEEESEDEKPLALRTSQFQDDEDDEDDVPLDSRVKQLNSDTEGEDYKPEKKSKKTKKRKSKHSSDDEESEEDYKPAKKKAAVSKPVKGRDKKESVSPRKGKKEEEQPEVWKWWEENKRSDGNKWTFLQHKGPMFAPAYERLPKSVKFYYDGKEIRLSKEAEEVATFYSKMLNHDYTSKDSFNTNFFTDWRKVMTSEEQSMIKSLKKCNFKDMAKYFEEKSEERKAMSKEEKKKIKEQNDETQKEYGFCLIDGHKEKIGNFRIEPPGLFRGRGEHPKMGMLKRRVMPEDVIINCSKDSEYPKAPDGHRWKEVRHDPQVTWLASWTENVQGNVKYVMLNPSSKLKGEKDMLKYEMARKLAKKIGKIREQYIADWKSKEMRIRQRAVALYFIDRLALRAGNEKDEDQADTVGCCSLRVEHVSLHEELNGKEYVVVFDFLGKDSIRYYNEVPVEKRVFKNLQLFMDNKKTGDDLFDRLNTTVLNKHLNELMEGLTAKVFRTYNASWTLQEQLDKLTNADDTVPEKILSYNRANRAVAILCNHQRAIPKTHEKSMGNLKAKIDVKKDAIADVKQELKDAQRSRDSGTTDKKKKQLERLKDQLVKLEIQETDREENKTIALGTSKLNYLDPRISVAWCKKYDVPIEKIYNKTQRDKFRWAIDMAGPDYIF